MIVKDHKLFEADGKPVKFVQTPNVSPGTITIDSIVIHYTANMGGEGAVRSLTTVGREVSAHLVVDWDGTTWQLSNFNTKTWHAGRSFYNGRRYHNNFSVGIEIVNPGYLTETNGKFYTVYKNEVAPENVFKGAHRNAVTRSTLWHKYPEVQIQKVEAICKALCEFYDIQEIVGHEEILPGAKCDPGPAFPLDEMRDKLLNKGQALPAGATGETTDLLNIREEPSAEATKVAKALPKGQKVNLIKEIDTHYRVTTLIDGWVAKDFIQTNNADDEFDGIVSATSLNIRSGPNGSESPVAQPLPRGTKVKIMTQDNGWYHVQTEVRGWVEKPFVKRLA